MHVADGDAVKLLLTCEHDLVRGVALRIVSYHTASFVSSNSSGTFAYLLHACPKPLYLHKGLVRSTSA